jgi:predicted RNA methylase
MRQRAQRGAKAERSVGQRKNAPVRARAPGGESRPLLLLLTEPGLATTLVKELKFRGALKTKARADNFNLRNYDLLVLPASQVVGDVRSSRLALHALNAPFFGRGTITERQLDMLATSWTAARPDGLVSSVSGSWAQRQDLLRWLTKQLHQRGIRVPEQEEAKRPGWLMVVDQFYWLGFPYFNYHQAEGRTGADRGGALPPVVAAAMAFIGVPGPNEVICDPVVGSGSVLLEAAYLAKDAQFIGVDIDERAVAIARGRLRNVENVKLMAGDSGEIDFGRSDISLTLANLPWGKQFQAERPLWEVYRDILQNTLRQARPNWRGVFLTSDTEALARAVKAVGGLTKSQSIDVRVRGVEASISLFERRA